MYLYIVLLLATVLRTYLIDLYSHFATALHCLQFAVSYSLSQFVPCADVTADKLSCTIVVLCCVYCVYAATTTAAEPAKESKTSSNLSSLKWGHGVTQSALHSRYYMYYCYYYCSLARAYINVFMVSTTCSIDTAGACVRRRAH
jgi:hypothetical protein